MNFSPLLRLPKGPRMLPDSPELPDGIVFSDMQGQVTGFSPSTMTMFRYTQDGDRVDRRITDFLVPEDRERAAAHFSRRLAGEEPGQKHYWGLREDGTTFPIEVNGQTILGADGRPREVLFILRDLSGRRGIEQKLQKASQLLQAACKVAGMGHVITDLQDPAWPWSCSPEVNEMLGIDLDFEKNWEGGSTLLHPDDRDRVLARLSESLHKQQPFSDQFRILRPTDGELRWIAAWADTQYDQDGKPLQHIGILQDITADQRVKQAVAESEARYRTWFGLPLVGIAVSSPSKGWLEVNEHLCTMLGYTPEELRSMTWAEITHPEDLASDEAQFERVLSGKLDGYSLEKRFIRRDGSSQPSELSTRCVRRADGKVDHMVTLVQDISERRKAEDALLDAHQHLASLVAAIPGVVYQFLVTPDHQWKFLYVSEGIQDLYGVAPQEALRDHNALTERIHPEDQEPHRQAVIEAANNFKFWADEHRIITPEGRLKWVRGYAQPVRQQDGGVLWNGVLLDWTDRKLAEEETLHLQQQLQQAQKMESLGSLAGGVAHDMNNVLGAILGLASAHIDSLPYGSPVHKALDTICKATERGGKMVKSLLSFARQSPTEERKLDVNAVLKEQVTLLERTTLAKVQLQLKLEPNLHPILGDVSALTHAFMNLCVNAVDAMPDRGTLILHTRNVDSHWIEVVVEDNGIGMQKEVLEKAMDPFFTTKGVGKGTGLGLSMVFSTVQAHRGHIVLQSEPGQGTRVVLRFPTCEQESPSQAPGPVVTKKVITPQGPLDVLLVDDDDLVQGSIQMLLEVMGHRVNTAGTGERALRLLEEGLEPDLVILDMNMPGLGGTGTLPRLRGLRPKVPVLLSTGRADHAAVDLASAHPGVILVAKPFGLRELQAHIESVGLG